ncbi:hypothetical protein C7212DRAFT_341495 [Tuber magnatum]|uniref:Uncharacterized protein n=1 Tax=Tuber magnatum TaxID=42249 RepID=A0A317SWR5_9PEZI|nr:hypothetical protein C7212DRAFT_341495 [Tuber magnatum]
MAVPVDGWAGGGPFGGNDDGLGSWIPGFVSPGITTDFFLILTALPRLIKWNEYSTLQTLFPDTTQVGRSWRFGTRGFGGGCAHANTLSDLSDKGVSCHQASRGNLFLLFRNRIGLGNTCSIRPFRYSANTGSAGGTVGARAGTACLLKRLGNIHDRWHPWTGRRCYYYTTGIVRQRAILAVEGNNLWYEYVIDVYYCYHYYYYYYYHYYYYYYYYYYYHYYYYYYYYYYYHYYYYYYYYYRYCYNGYNKADYNPAISNTTPHSTNKLSYRPRAKFLPGSGSGGSNGSLLGALLYSTTSTNRDGQ